MNRFILDTTPLLIAQSQCDKHAVKMCLEETQMLCTAHRLAGDAAWCDAQGLYKATHVNHPCAVWARQTDSNYNWALELWDALMTEYTYRFGKVHACERFLEPFLVLPARIPIGPLTPHPQCMPDKYKQADVVAAYRAYYNGEKHRMYKWTGRSAPSWTIYPRP